MLFSSPLPCLPSSWHWRTSFTNWRCSTQSRSYSLVDRRCVGSCPLWTAWATRWWSYRWSFHYSTDSSSSNILRSTKTSCPLNASSFFFCGIFFLSFLIIKVPLFAWIIPDGMCYAADTLTPANPYQHQPEALNKVHLFLQAGGVYAFALLVVLIVLSLIANIAAYDHSLKKFQSDEGIQRNPERVKRNQRAILVELLFKTIGLIVFSSSIATLNFISFQKEEEESTVIKRDNAQIGQGCSTAADFCPFCISSTPHWNSGFLTLPSNHASRQL